jgi:hypothetical protein
LLFSIKEIDGNKVVERFLRGFGRANLQRTLRKG